MAAPPTICNLSVEISKGWEDKNIQGIAKTGQVKKKCTNPQRLLSTKTREVPLAHQEIHN